MEDYDAWHLAAVMRILLFVSFGIFALNAIEPQVAVCQNANSQRNECVLPENLNPTKTIVGTYTEEATKKNVEGTVVLCVTVDGRGRVTTVTPVSGPPELLQPSMDAAKRWEFDAPRKAPASTKIEMSYRMTKPCPEGKGSDVGDIVVTIEPTNEKGDLKILGKLYQPLPPYPETARAERRRGQLYLSVVVNPDGNVTDVRIVRPLDELLDEPAVETVRTWRFKVSPDGKPTRFSLTLSFRIPCLDDR